MVRFLPVFLCLVVVFSNPDAPEDQYRVLDGINTVLEKELSVLGDGKVRRLSPRFLVFLSASISLGHARPDAEPRWASQARGAGGGAVKTARPSLRHFFSWPCGACCDVDVVVVDAGRNCAVFFAATTLPRQGTSKCDGIHRCPGLSERLRGHPGPIVARAAPGPTCQARRPILIGFGPTPSDHTSAQHSRAPAALNPPRAPDCRSSAQTCSPLPRSVPRFALHGPSSSGNQAPRATSYSCRRGRPCSWRRAKMWPPLDDRSDMSPRSATCTTSSFVRTLRLFLIAVLPSPPSTPLLLHSSAPPLLRSTTPLLTLRPSSRFGATCPSLREGGGPGSWTPQRKRWGLQRLK